MPGPVSGSVLRDRQYSAGAVLFVSLGACPSGRLIGAMMGLAASECGVMSVNVVSNSVLFI